MRTAIYDIQNSTDFSVPFGMALPKRNFEGGIGYRYGFNGGENINEILGKDTYVDLGERGVDVRLGRLNWKIDPLATTYPFMSPYCYAANNPVLFIDKNGEGPYLEANANNTGYKLVFNVILYPQDGMTVNDVKDLVQQAYGMRGSGERLLPVKGKIGDGILCGGFRVYDFEINIRIMDKVDATKYFEDQKKIKANYNPHKNLAKDNYFEIRPASSGTKMGDCDVTKNIGFMTTNVFTKGKDSATQAISGLMLASGFSDRVAAWSKTNNRYSWGYAGIDSEGLNADFNAINKDNSTIEGKSRLEFGEASDEMVNENTFK